MRITLPESRRRRRRRTPAVVASATVHAALLAVVIVRRGWTATTASPAVETVSLQYTESRAARTDRAAAATEAMNRRGDPASLPPPRLEIPQIVIGNVAVPAGIDPAAALAPFDPSEIGSEAGRAAHDSGGRPTDEVFVWSSVERPVSALPGNPTPPYPDVLARAGVEGSVTVRFVVDTLGAVERGSLEVVGASHALFAESVRATVTRLRFSAAEWNGRRVRQVVEQTFQFAIRR